MSGLNIDQFNIILNCDLPYIDLIPYRDCVGGRSHGRLESATELLPVLMNFVKESWATLLECQMLLLNAYSVTWFFFLQHYSMKQT